MTCRHAAGDPNCSSYVAPPPTPNPDQYEVVDAVRVGNHLVLKVLYPSCQKCSYEGNKVLVFLNVTEKEVIRWRKIDPHFRPFSGKNPPPTEAPGPAARFPASVNGWNDAITYARSKVPPVTPVTK